MNNLFSSVHIWRMKQIGFMQSLFLNTSFVWWNKYNQRYTKVYSMKLLIFFHTHLYTKWEHLKLQTIGGKSIFEEA